MIKYKLLTIKFDLKFKVRLVHQNWDFFQIMPISQIWKDTINTLFEKDNILSNKYFF